MIGSETDMAMEALFVQVELRAAAKPLARLSDIREGAACAAADGASGAAFVFLYFSPKRRGLEAPNTMRGRVWP